MAMEENKQVAQVVNFNEALSKAEHYCAYQERSQHEVRVRLRDFGLLQDQVEQLISLLIETNFLNEERFAVGYALGKFRIKRWGKAKIKQGLRLKKVPEKLIAKAIAQINDDEYIITLKELIEKKSGLLNEKDPRKKDSKLSRYALGKGFEIDLIIDVLKAN